MNKMQCIPAGVHGFLACSVRKDTRQQARWSLARRRVAACLRSMLSIDLLAAARVIVIVGVGSSIGGSPLAAAPLGVEPRSEVAVRRGGSGCVRLRRRGDVNRCW